MAQCVRVQVTLNPTADSDDWIVNTWHIATLGAATPLQAATSFKVDVNNFYQAIDQIMGASLTGFGPPSYKAYNLIEVKPRVAIYEDTLTALAPAATALPRELAVCVSYKAAYTSGVNPQRRRGRIYVGPWGTSLNDNATGQISASALTTVVAAADALVTAASIASTYQWVVYSPTTDTNGTGETGFYPVTSGWVDNQWDIQRSRGSNIAARSTFSP